MSVDLDVACFNWPYALNNRIKCIIYSIKIFLLKTIILSHFEKTDPSRLAA